ncbi:hypothetical protein DPMN_139991 [Dreissena polymorpha]|uniref:Uncharacterized protein n=1 Tax=Dreissena polymorpha TaxID=45954 RepID=A0A9D4JG84_DREPO|nr:hypothetical protein DPMN_139991 [Dreissena polymorpha]
MALAKSTKDLLLVAEDYLSRGQVYRPAGEFIKKLALCPSCFGGRQEVERMLGVVSRVGSGQPDGSSGIISVKQAWTAEREA